jgi:protein involved in polysaccharide export with SLBB domain
MKIVLLLVILVSLAISTHAQQTSGNESAVTANKKACIVGNVSTQREIIFDGRLTVTDAIKQAGGIRPDKKDTEVIVISQMTNDWRGRVIYVDLKAIKKNPYMDLVLQDLDIIEVLSRKPDKTREPFVNPCPWVPVFKDRM